MNADLQRSASWFKRINKAFGQPPVSYLVVDVETTGLDTSRDFITQVGFCKVINGDEVERDSIILNWTKYPGIDQADFEARLRKCTRDMAACGKTCQVPFERVQEEGFAPDEVLDAYTSLIRTASKDGWGFVGHNVWGFDIPLLERHFRAYAGDNFTFPKDTTWDTGLMEKARQLEHLPLRGTALYDFYQYVRSRRVSGVVWNLDRHCVPLYGLVEKHALDLTNAHDAAYDCYLTHLVLEAQRELMLEADVPVA